MRLRQFLLPLLLLAAAVSLAETAATRRGIGPFEWIVVAVILAALVYGAFQLSRRAMRRT